MTRLHHRARSKANASLISIAQRVCDITIIFLGLYVSFLLNNRDFSYNQFVVVLLVLAVFQMFGGITDFYRSWRGVKFTTELNLILKNWTLSLLLITACVTYSKELWLPFSIFLEWYIFVCVGVVLCRLMIRVCAKQLDLLVIIHVISQ